jgi:hypothetical protein
MLNCSNHSTDSTVVAMSPQCHNDLALTATSCWDPNPYLCTFPYSHTTLSTSAVLHSHCGRCQLCHETGASLSCACRRGRAVAYMVLWAVGYCLTIGNGDFSAHRRTKTPEPIKTETGKTDCINEVTAGAKFIEVGLAVAYPQMGEVGNCRNILSPFHRRTHVPNQALDPQNIRQPTQFG